MGQIGRCGIKRGARRLTILSCRAVPPLVRPAREAVSRRCPAARSACACTRASIPSRDAGTISRSWSKLRPGRRRTEHTDAVPRVSPQPHLAVPRAADGRRARRRRARLVLRRAPQVPEALHGAAPDEPPHRWLARLRPAGANRIGSRGQRRVELLAEPGELPERGRPSLIVHTTHRSPCVDLLPSAEHDQPRDASMITRGRRSGGRLTTEVKDQAEEVLRNARRLRILPVRGGCPGRSAAAGPR
jgi:hypothetical protein